MFVSTINAISQSGQAILNKILVLQGVKVCRSPLQKPRKIPGHGEKILPAAAEKGTQPFQSSGGRPVLLGNHLPLEFRDLFQPLAA